MFGFGKKKKKNAPKSREELIAEAQANARKARETLGQETIEHIASQLADKNPFEALIPEEQRKPKTAADEARAFLEQMDSRDLVTHLRYIIEEDRHR